MKHRDISCERFVIKDGPAKPSQIWVHTYFVLKNLQKQIKKDAGW